MSFSHEPETGVSWKSITMGVRLLFCTRIKQKNNHSHCQDQTMVVRISEAIGLGQESGSYQ